MQSSPSPTSLALPALIPAAGLSSRMGSFKPLLPFGSRPMLVRVIESLQLAGGIDPIIIVTGHRQSELKAALPDPSVIFAHNPDYEHGGMISSVRAGLAALPSNGPGFILALGDQPAVHPSTIRLLIDAWHSSTAAIAMPTFNGERGHPVIFAARCIRAILALPPGETLKSVRAQYTSELLQVPVDDPAVVADVDTPADYQRTLGLWRSRNPAG